MIKAIVYESNSGFTKKYAEMLAAKTNLPVYDRKLAKADTEKGEEIIYMGWICAGNVKGYEKAAKKYTVKVVCAVGMGSPTEKVVNETIEHHRIQNAKVFYLQGGFDMSRLHGIYKIMMKMMGKTLGKSLEKKADKTNEEIKMLEMLKNGGDFVNEKYLDPIITRIQKF